MLSTYTCEVLISLPKADGHHYSLLSHPRCFIEKESHSQAWFLICVNSITILFPIRKDQKCQHLEIFEASAESVFHFKLWLANRWRPLRFTELYSCCSQYIRGHVGLKHKYFMSVIMWTFYCMRVNNKVWFTGSYTHKLIHKYSIRDHLAVNAFL